MIVLGITDSYTSGAALIADGRVLAAVQEERLNRLKMSMGFPLRSIEAVLRIAGLEVKDIDHVAVATDRLFWRPEAGKLPDYFRESKGPARDLFLGAGSVFSALTGGNRAARRGYYALKGLATRGRRRHIPRLLAERWGYRGPVSFVDHHLAHCAAAYFCSGFDSATVMSLDGAGDNCSSHVYRVEGGRFTKLHTIDSYDSIGNYYAYVTHLCGFKAHQHEGKITGLAAYGSPRYADLLRTFVRFQKGTIRNTGGGFDHSAIRKLAKALGPDFSHEDLAASIQLVLEETVTQFVDHWVKAAGSPRLAVAGGVMANVKLNQRLHELDSVDEVVVHPGMGDDGLAVGAALHECFELARHTGASFHRENIRDVYWGPDITQQDAMAAVQRAGLEFEYHADMARPVAQLLAQGKVVARTAGRMEYGPRALGNRTILYQPTDPSVNDWLNVKLHRTEFMPFAPVTLAERARDCYVGLTGAEDAARFMTVTFDCTTQMSQSSPAVVHVDNTARPQLIHRDVNPDYHAILVEYEKLTGLPSLINTSFNMHEEPIVCTADDAVRAFTSAKLDYLALGNLLVRGVRTDREETAGARRSAPLVAATP